MILISLKLSVTDHPNISWYPSKMFLFYIFSTTDSKQTCQFYILTGADIECTQGPAAWPFPMQTWTYEVKDFTYHTIYL